MINVMSFSRCYAFLFASHDRFFPPFPSHLYTCLYTTKRRLIKSFGAAAARHTWRQPHLGPSAQNLSSFDKNVNEILSAQSSVYSLIRYFSRAKLHYTPEQNQRSSH